jgi:hypothetical protein
MSKRGIKYIHIFIWLFAIFANFPYSGIPDHMTMKEITTFIIAFLYLMLVFYVFYLFLVPFFLNRKMIGEFFGFSFLIVLIMPFIGYTILYFNRALFEGMKDYLRIVCTNKKIMTLQSFQKIEEILPLKKFCRVHKSFIVAIEKIKSIERGVIIIADHRIPVSNTYKESFFSRIKQ